MLERCHLSFCRTVNTPVGVGWPCTPVETADVAVEDTILRELTVHPPDRVALVTRDVHEYGSRGFGVGNKTPGEESGAFSTPQFSPYTPMSISVLSYHGAMSS